MSLLNIRRGLDGSYWIPREHPETEAWLDSQYTRDKTRRLYWVNKLPDQMKMLHNTYNNETCYIVGKGGSLDNIHEGCFDEHGPILCINESIHKIEALELEGRQLFAMQMDSTLAETCRPKSQDVTLLVSPRCNNLYEDWVKRVVVDPVNFGFNDNCISAVCAVGVARYFGCSKVVMVSFDGCMKKDYHYAKCIGYASTKGGSPLRFAEHSPLIKEAAKNIALEWVLPLKGKKKTTTQAL